LKTIEISTASKPLSEYIEEFEDGDILLTSHHRPIAVIIPVTESDKEAISLGSNPDFIEIIENARAEFRAGKTISLEDMKHEVLEDL
jgi:prevent-host-death family protein